MSCFLKNLRDVSNQWLLVTILLSLDFSKVFNVKTLIPILLLLNLFHKYFKLLSLFPIISSKHPPKHDDNIHNFLFSVLSAEFYEFFHVSHLCCYCNVSTHEMIQYFLCSFTSLLPNFFKQNFCQILFQILYETTSIFSYVKFQFSHLFPFYFLSFTGHIKKKFGSISELIIEQIFLNCQCPASHAIIEVCSKLSLSDPKGMSSL